MIDLDVIPRVALLFRWGELKHMLQNNALSHAAGLFAESIMDLYELKSKRPIQDDERLDCPGYYFFGLAEDNALSLVLEPNSGGREDVEYIDDFARNVPPQVKESILRQWELAGFLATVSSNAGRAKGELGRMIRIAGCIAKLTNGYVVVTEKDLFARPVGVYSWDDFT